MPGVKTLADARMKVTMITTLTSIDIDALTATQLNAGVDVSCLLAKAGTRFSATASDTTSDPALCEESNTPVLGASNYEASVAVYWLLDGTDGAYVAADNAAYEALRVKGSRVVFAVREGPNYADTWATADTYDAFEVISDNPQRPSETSGYVKRSIPLLVQSAALDKAVVAGV